MAGLPGPAATCAMTLARKRVMMVQPKPAVCCCRVAVALLSALHRRHDSLWRGQAMRSLPALMAASDMLICGEDLGFVPACLPPVMQVLVPPGWLPDSCVCMHAAHGVLQTPTYPIFPPSLGLRLSCIPYAPVCGVAPHGVQQSRQARQEIYASQLRAQVCQSMRCLTHLCVCVYLACQWFACSAGVGVDRSAHPAHAQ